jgi:hypothetical protein
MHVHMLNLCMHIHIIFFSLYKMSQIYFLLKVIVII